MVTAWKCHEIRAKRMAPDRLTASEQSDLGLDEESPEDIEREAAQWRALATRTKVAPIS